MIFLSITAVIYVISCWLTYSDYKNEWWYIPIGVFLGVITGIVWYTAVKVFDDKQRMYVFNLLWDAMMMAIYYIMPLLLFDVKLTKWMVAGMTLIVAGAIVIKIK